MSRDWGVLCAPALRRMKIPGNPRMLRSDAVDATPATVSLVRTWYWIGVGGKVGLPRVWIRAGGKVGFSCLLGVPVSPTLIACGCTCLRWAAGRVLCGGSRRSLSAWTCNRDTDNARALMLSMIWSSLPVPIPGVSFPPSTSENSCPSLSPSSLPSALSSEPE